MAITPTGSPAWLRTVSYADYGGHASKENFLSRGAINPLTDVAAEEFSRMVGDQAAVVRTAEFGVFTILCRDGGGASDLPPLIEFAAMMPSGVRTTSYSGDAAPAGFPSGVRNGNGDITLTFDTSYTDDYGVVGAYSPRSPVATLQSASAGDVPCVASGQTVRCRAFDVSGSAISNARFSLTVF